MRMKNENVRRSASPGESASEEEMQRKREKMERVRDSKGGVVMGRGWLRDSVQKMELKPTVALLYLYEKIRIYCRWNRPRGKFRQ